MHLSGLIIFTVICFNYSVIHAKPRTDLLYRKILSENLSNCMHFTDGKYGKKRFVNV